MQIICISCHSYGYGKELAEKLASELGYDHIAREELADQATERGIPVGKLETAILKHQLITEELSIEIERFKAFITAEICKRTKKRGVVYHGRMGHMVLQGLPNVIRIRATSDEKERINRVMQRMNLNSKQAKNYIEQVDEDRCRYTKYFYNVDCNEPILFDLVANSTNLSINDSVTALINLTRLPEFQPTPESNQKIEDLLLQSQCRLAIAEDARTRVAKVDVKAYQGNVSLTYLPAFVKQAEFIPQVLKKIENMRSLVCTMAATNILCIQERFNPDADTFNHLVEIAGKWNASVELVRLVHQMRDDKVLQKEEIAQAKFSDREKNGGILDDTSETEEDEKDKYGVPETINRLIQVGRAGAVNTIYGGVQPLANMVKSSKGNCLVVVGDVFLSSGSASQKRMKRDLISLLSDQSRVPVISSDDLKEQYLFGPKQRIKTLVFALISVLLFYFVFTNQELILKFLTPSDTEFKILAVLIIALSVPLAAYVIGNLWHNILKLVKLE
ncbi:MAG: cytidylate kinase-like family protein [Ignavibacteriaceae bacterium]|nr:cytidylate kinase-like family protein [Ignavibacteriaceae bacterium]MCW8822961.1 cytidylate kinase-like family protein [Ignavibacteriaceae bacterium]MCW8960311.1 cytidylate kinase-like family protein [Ignavibacteriaceae bacterium]MCW9095273.1 cytidylate kinase-like family protein [Ignavibacteriaceae bacterium]MCW9098303.1 cytidylate kinase-like family protein [Ignavibacteriaceae bacterium]